jgi:hypothetical protein
MHERSASLSKHLLLLLLLLVLCVQGTGAQVQYVQWNNGNYGA